MNKKVITPAIYNKTTSQTENPVTDIQDINKIRNIAIVAHVDQRQNHPR
ncbi:hypothetical protein HMPREF9080_01915 [Cardiobacterium valvarum F0432]|uniref:Uncharacterized protein n=1 Tax=Cardiobacterium valvarum F0432 TaxID=797473 RepID=G9ZGL1_9GAMM|nr:hypothetical protein HMPREF9080_01915 [Cardiobacterium valvarum F0432]